MAENRIKKSDISEDDIFGLIGQSAEKNLVSLEKMDKQLTEIATKLKVVFKNAGKGSLSEINNLVNGSNQLNNVTKKLVEVEKQKTISTKALTIEQAKQKEILRQANLEARANAKIQLAQKGSVEQLRAQLSLVSLQWAKVTKAEGENSKIAKQLGNEKADLTNKIKTLEAATGDHRRNVGNYTSALDGLQGKFRSLIGLASQFGLALGGVAIVRNAFNVIKDFDQGVANLASVLGKTRAEIQGLEEDAKRLGATTRFTASEVAQLQTEFAKLGFTQQEIKDATEATLSLAAATGTDLARSAEVAGSTVRAFGLNADQTQRTVDVMAKSFSTSALDMESFAESMKFVAPVSKAAGLSLEETTAMLGALANAGIKGSNAGTALRQIISEMDKTGKSTAEAIADLAAKGLNLADAEDEVGKNAKTALLVLADQTKQVASLTGEYENASGAAKTMADTQLQTVGGALDLLTSAWEGFILKMNDASGAGRGLANGIKFLADNLETILNVLIQAIKFWGIYKIATSSVTKNIITFGKELFKAKGNLIQANKAMQQGSESSRKFGAALKGIVWTALIGLAFEFGQQLFHIASGAAQAEEDLARLNAAAEKATESVGKNIQAILDKTSKNIAQIQRDFNERNISQDQFLKSIEDEEKLTLKQLELNKKLVEERKAGYDEVIRQINMFREMLNGTTSQQDLAFRSLKRIAKERGFENHSDVLGQMTANANAAQIKIDEYSKAIADSDERVKDASSSIRANTKDTSDNNKSKEKTISLLREIEDERIKQIKDEDARAMVQATVEANRRIEDVKKTKANEQEKADLIIEINKNLSIELEHIAKQSADKRAEIERERIRMQNELLSEMVDIDIPDIVEEEDKKIQDANKKRRLELLESGRKTDDIQKEITQNEIDELEKRIEFREALGIDALDLELELAEKRRALRDKEAEEEKKRQEDLKDFFEKAGEEVLNGFIERSKKREEQLQSEIDQSKALEDALREQAQNGNAIASQSLAEQQRITAEKEKLRKQEQQKQQALEEAKIIMQSIQNFMEQGDSLPTATAKSVALTTGIRKIIESIPGFFKGTKGKLGDEMTATRSGRDGHLIWADKDEMILNPTKVNDLENAGITTTDEVVKNAILYKGMSNTVSSNSINVDFSDIVYEIKELNKTIQNKTEYSLHPELKMGILNGLIEVQKKGNYISRTYIRK